MVALTELHYISLKQIQVLKKNGIETVEDLLYYYPTRFEDYTVIPKSQWEIGKTITIVGEVISKVSFVNLRSNLNIMTFYVAVEGEKVKVSIFNRQFLYSKLHYGKYIRLTGKFDGNFKKFTAANLSLDEFENSILPIFNLKGIDDKKVLDLKEKVFYEYHHLLQEYLPQTIREKFGLLGIEDTIQCINMPMNIEDTVKATYRIKFEELLLYQLKVKYMLYMRKQYPEGIVIAYDGKKVQKFISNLPFKLTTDQNKAVMETLSDISSPFKMNRLLQGEVGSGKTIVAAICLYAVTTAGYQGAIMVPTEVLAYQHYQTFKDLFANYNLHIELLSSSLLSKDKKVILDRLANGDIDIIVGTHSLFQKNVFFAKLGLVVTDEEHRFGVRQRVSLVGKGYLIDHLKMSATPIPRTLAISVLGDNDISIIKSMPGNKKEVITKYCDYEERHTVFKHIEEEVKRGRQVYIVTPAIEESVMDLKNATDVYENTKRYYQDIGNVGLIHGRLQPEEKEQVMRDFYENKIQILVSTSVIEVGVNVINATTIVILDADRFGIAQLHQMRGRVCRSDHQAYCFLISKATNEVAIKRLKLVEANSDGFVLAEEDLRLRGAGDIFGEKQTGYIDFKMANFIDDENILEQVDQVVTEMFTTKALFTEPEYKLLRSIAHNNYQKNKEFLE